MRSSGEGAMKTEGTSAGLSPSAANISWGHRGGLPYCLMRTPLLPAAGGEQQEAQEAG